MFEFVMTKDADGAYEADGHCKRVGGEYAPSLLVRPRRLQFSIDAELKRVIESQLRIGQELAESVDLHVEIFNEFGKGFIKQARLSPDAFIQMALQLAFFLVQPFICY